MGAGTTDEPPAAGAGHIVHAAVSRPVIPTLHQRELGMLLHSLRVGRRELFKLDDTAADQLAELVQEASQPGWWADYQDLGVPYTGLEQHASSITSYTMQYFPALLQTREYARAIITAIAPQIEPKILEERVEARLRRQHVLNSPGDFRYAVLLDEAVLRRPVGGRAVIYQQLGKVITAIRAHRVDLRIVPFEHVASIAQDTNFVLLQFNEPGPLRSFTWKGSPPTTSRMRSKT